MLENIIEISNLPKELVDSYDFTELYSYKPKTRSSVLVYDKEKGEHFEKEIFRSYLAYLNVPEFDKNIKKSYMFSNKSDTVPEAFTHFLLFAKSIDSRYNQMVINWYNPEDYIEPHRDCTAKMLFETAPILVINLNETSKSDRNLLLDPVKGSKFTEQINVPMQNNTFYVLKNNSDFRHSVGTGSEKRISITFRMIKA